VDSRFEGAILKPLSSVDFAGRHGVKGYFVENRQQAVEALKIIDPPIMLQEFIPGPPTAGYFLDGFRDRSGRITALFARRRLRMYPAKLGNSTLIESVPIDEIREARSSLEYLLANISYRGVFSAEFKLDSRDGEFKLIEINARPWWYVEFAHHCGVNVCNMAYRDALGLSVEPVVEYEIGRRCAFTVNELRACRTSGPAESSLLSIVYAWLSSHNTLFHWSDPLPTIRYLEQTVRAFWPTHGDKIPRCEASAALGDTGGSLVSTPLSKPVAD
jgi:predicted ATP-grasp superfamily ATP-dependent carboligase